MNTRLRPFRNSQRKILGGHVENVLAKKVHQNAKIAKKFGAKKTGRAYTKAVPTLILILYFLKTMHMFKRHFS